MELIENYRERENKIPENSIRNRKFSELHIYSSSGGSGFYLDQYLNPSVTN